MIEITNWKFIIVMLLLTIIIIITGFLIYINVHGIKNIEKKCLTISDVKHLPCIQSNNSSPSQSIQPVPNPNSKQKKKYTCQDLLDQYNQIVPHILWNEQYRTIIIEYLNQMDSTYDIKYLNTLNNYTLFLLTQSICAPENIYKGECLGFGISDLRNTPYNKWSSSDRINAINDIYSIFAMDINYLQNLNNKTLHDLIKISCSNY